MPVVGAGNRDALEGRWICVILHDSSFFGLPLFYLLASAIKKAASTFGGSGFDSLQKQLMRDDFCQEIARTVGTR